MRRGSTVMASDVLPVSRLLRITLVSQDALQLATFLERALGFHRLEHAPSGAPLCGPANGAGGRAFSTTLSLGQQQLELLQFASAGKPYPQDTRSSDLLFQHAAIVVSDMDEAFRQLSAVAGWTAISRNGPQALPEKSGGVTAFKFRDPEGHPFELLAFPPAERPAQWKQANSQSPFLGIDHSAISVADTGVSVAFYEAVGLSVSGGSVNTGIEQERLDALPNPRVTVTALSAGATAPHLELLCYQQRGTPIPGISPVRDNDVAATRTIWQPQVANRPGDAERPSRILVDPDGHRVLITRF